MWTKKQSEIVSIKHDNFSLGENPFQESRKEKEILKQLLKEGITEVLDLKGTIKDKTVFIKPNLNFTPGDINPYCMTDPRLLLALVELVYDCGAKKILVGEKPGQKRRSIDSYNLLRENFEIPDCVRLVEIDKDEYREIKTLTALVSPKLGLPAVYLDADFVIDMPKMKTHTLTEVSLGMKNLFGLLTDEEKMRHHNEDIHSKLVDLLSVRSPDLTIVDGLFALEGQGPLYGTLRRANLLIVGNNCVSTDAVSSYIMGFDPKKIPCIKLASEAGLGKINLDEIEFPSIAPDSVRQNFKRGNLKLNPFKQVTIILGKEIPAGYFNAISHSLERLKSEKLKPETVKIYVGKFSGGEIEDDAIIFGDVTRQSVRHKKARVISGHPPRAFELYEILKNISHSHP